MNLLTFRIIIFTGFIFTTALAAQAQAPRTWVSGTGDDSLPCSRTAPCKTFQMAITKAAPNGEVSCLDASGYGPVVVTKSITINCPGIVGGILANSANGSGVTINVPGGTVRLRGLSITGFGLGANGVNIIAAGSVYIEDTDIDGFTANGVKVVVGANLSLFISNSTIRNNSTGIAISPVSVKDSTVVLTSVFNSRIIGNRSFGINAVNSDTAVTNCLIAGNDTGITTSAGATVRISGNTISENKTGLSPQATSFIVSYGNNAIGDNVTANGLPTSTVARQ